MKTALVLATALSATLAAVPAFADDTATSVSATSSPSAADKPGVLEVQLEMMPVGSLGVKGQRGDILIEDEKDTAFAGGISARMEYDVLPHLSVGVAPRIIFNVKQEGAPGDLDEVDLRARVTGHVRVGSRVELFAFVAPGYSMLLPHGHLDNYPSGFSLGAGAGANIDINKDAFVALEAGYQLGFQRIEEEDVDFSTDYLHVGLGIGTRF